MKINKFILKQIFDIKTYGIRELFRKLYLLIKIIARIPIYIIAIVPCIIIRSIRPWITIRIARISSTNFGNLARDPALYYCKKKLKIDLPTSRHIDLVYIHHKDKTYNKQLAKMWKRKLNFLSSYLLDPINRVNKFIPGWKIHAIKLTSTGRLFDSLSDKCQPLDFTNEEEIYGKKMLSKFGLKDNDKFVCLAIRDGAYQLRKIPTRFRDWSYHEYRNWDIDKFILAAEELAKKGYYVLRMGDVVEKPFNSNNPKIIDYANSNLRSDFLDIYLGAKCTFCVSSGLGFDELATIFRKPVVLIYAPVATVGKNREKVLLLYKHHILKKENRRLSLSEIFSHGVAYTMDSKVFEEKGIELVDNTPEEIRDVVIEMAENLEFKIQPNSEDEELQKTFRSLLALNNKRFIPSGADPKSMGIREHAHFYGPIKLRHSTKFLRENKNWLR